MKNISASQQLLTSPVILVFHEKDAIHHTFLPSHPFEGDGMVMWEKGGRLFHPCIGPRSATHIGNDQKPPSPPGGWRWVGHPALQFPPYAKPTL